jgi:hypothetical protein
VKRFKGREPPLAPRGQTEFLFTHDPRRKVVEMMSSGDEERGREGERERERKRKKEGERERERGSG